MNDSSDQLNLFLDGATSQTYCGAKENPPHSLGHIDCPACKELRKMYLCRLSADMPFEEAASLYMKMRQIDIVPGAVRSARYITESTADSYNDYIGSLTLFFGGMKLGQIDLEALEGYKIARVNGFAPFIRYRRPHDAKPRMINGVLIPAKGKTPCPAHPDKIKQELNFLIALMKRASVWTPEMEEFFEHLQGGEREVRRALTPEEHTLWLDLSASQERWQIVHWYSIASIEQTTSTWEIRGLRIGDVNLRHQLISVPWPSSKNRYRHREITIESELCYWAFEQLLLRARELGSVASTHYLLPFKFKGNRKKGQPQYDPTRPMTVTGLKTRWDEVRDATRTVADPVGLSWFRMNDCRHTGATRLAEKGVNVEIIVKRMGHAKPEMRAHYTHISLSAQRAWMRDPREQFMRSQPQPGWYPPHQQPPSMQPQRSPRILQFCGRPVLAG